MGITITTTTTTTSSSLFILLFTLTATPFLYCTSASPETHSNITPILKTVSKADDDVSSGVEKIWCVAKNNADDASLQAAIDWACGQGGVDCGPIQTSGPCYNPNNLQSTASYVFNDYFQRNGRTEESCSFSGAAAVFSLDPSHENCKFPYSTMMVANGSFVATGSMNNDMSPGVITGRRNLVSVSIVLLLIAWL